MTLRRRFAYLAFSALAPAFALALVCFFLTGYFRVAWIFAVLIVLCMEGRVQAIGRVPRTTLFWTHVACAIPFFLVLTSIAFWYRTTALEVACALFFIGLVVTAGALWYRGLSRLFSTAVSSQ